MSHPPSTRDHRTTPRLPAYTDTRGDLRAWCDRCLEWHFHGRHAGHRVAHCADAQTGYTSYELVLIGEWTAEVRAAYALVAQAQQHIDHPELDRYGHRDQLARASDENVCAVCHSSISGPGVHWASYTFRSCLGPCRDVVSDHCRVFDRSRRGRFRTSVELLALIEGLRCVSCQPSTQAG